MCQQNLNNPYEAFDEFHCFGCSSKNRYGLRLQFTETESGVKTIWQPEAHYAGYANILHGGIQATLLDEVSAWIVYVKLDTAGVTSKFEIEYLKPIYIVPNSPITVETELLSYEASKAIIAGRILNAENQVCTQSVATFFIYPKAVAERRFRFPGKEAFYMTE